MNALVKKEIRLMLPALIVAVLLAMVQGFVWQYDLHNFYVASLLFFGLTLMALSTIGRESSLNTFSSLLALPSERLRIWQVKLSVLSVAFLVVLLVWLVALDIAWLHSDMDAISRKDSYNLLMTICLIATATFTGGLWTTLLLRQVVGAFWLTLLVPATLSLVSSAFLVGAETDSIVFAVLSVVIGTYSIAGFFVARRLFFRAQDVGWSGGVIALPEWKFLSRAGTGEAVRVYRPVFALLKKELQQYQGVLTGAAGVFVLHAFAIAVRRFHQFPYNSVGAGLAGLAWLPWQVLPALIGSMAVAEERKAGVMESQLCLPVSRRLQFTLKFLVAMCLGLLLGAVMPLLIEGIGVMLGAQNDMFRRDNNTPENLSDVFSAGFVLGNLGFSTSMVLASFFASSLAKNFLQAIGIALVSFVAWVLGMSALINGRLLLLDRSDGPFILPAFLAVPVIPAALVGLAWVNYTNFRDGWPLWRRNLLGFATAMLVIFGGSHAIYFRVWEVFEPAEPAHGPAQFSRDNAPELRNETYRNLLVRLPDGRVWFNYLTGQIPWEARSPLSFRFWFYALNPLPYSAGPGQFLPGSSWSDASARHVDEMVDVRVEMKNVKNGPHNSVRITGYADTVGIQKDGTLWASSEINSAGGMRDRLVQVGSDTNWLKFARSYWLTSMYLLKRDGTLWYWGTNNFDFNEWPDQWPGFRAFTPVQIGAETNWVDICFLESFYARNADGTIWRLGPYVKDGKPIVDRFTGDDPMNQILTNNYSHGGLQNWTAYVRPDGTLWMYGELTRNGQAPPLQNLQNGHDSDWAAVANTWNWMVAIKKDGTLWQWKGRWGSPAPAEYCGMTPAPLGTHHDWISVVTVENGVVALAADGSLWFWPDPYSYEYSEMLTRLPKQPRFVGNVFGTKD